MASAPRVSDVHRNSVLRHDHAPVSCADARHG